MALFQRRPSLFGGWFGRERVYEADPVVDRPYGYGYGTFLTPPSFLVFLVSAALAAAALLFRFFHVDVPVITSGNVFEVLAIAYVILFASVLRPRL